MNALTTINAATNAEVYRASTDAAGLCREIVVATATNIQGRSYVTVEGWQAIAIAHGCTAGARDVEKVEGGVRAIGEIRRMSDGIVISVAEGFVGEDEPTWFGGQSRGKTLPRRADYAIRAMAQTRAISRACRSAFAHVVVMMKANLSTTPAEEVPYGGFDDAHRPAAQQTVEQPRRADPVLDAMGGEKERVAPAAKVEGQRSKSAVWAAVKALDREMRGCGDLDTLDCLMATPENKALVAECAERFPFLLYGGDPLPPEHVGLFDLEAKMRAEFQFSEQAGELLDEMEGR